MGAWDLNVSLMWPVLWPVEVFADQLSEHVGPDLLDRLVQDQLTNNPIAGGLAGKVKPWR